MVICLMRGASGLHVVQLMPLPPAIISCFIKIQTGLTSLVLDYPAGCPRKEAVKCESVFCICFPCIFWFLVTASLLDSTSAVDFRNDLFLK